MSKNFDYEGYIKRYGAFPPLPTFNQWYKARWYVLVGFALNWEE